MLVARRHVSLGQCGLLGRCVLGHHGPRALDGPCHPSGGRRASSVSRHALHTVADPAHFGTTTPILQVDATAKENEVFKTKYSITGFPTIKARCPGCPPTHPSSPLGAPRALLAWRHQPGCSVQCLQW